MHGNVTQKILSNQRNVYFNKVKSSKNLSKILSVSNSLKKGNVIATQYICFCETQIHKEGSNFYQDQLPRYQLVF